MISSKSYKVCVFCGSKSGNHESYLKIAFKVGKELSEKKYTIIYGGGKVGLMGALAEGVTSNKGDLFSIIPKYFKDKNVDFHSLSSYDYLLEQALDINYITDNEFKILKDWKKNPAQWKI